MATSQNGYSANDVSVTKVWTIPGTERKVRLRADACGELLTHFAAWFDKHVEDIEGGEFDDWGYAERTIRGSSTELSNHASGTALDLNAVRHPLGVSGTFSSTKAAAIRAQLRVYEGCIRWGGDYSGRKDEMHFEINQDYATVKRVADKVLRSADTAPRPDFNSTIATKAIVLAYGGQPMNPTDGYYADARQMLAWGRSLAMQPVPTSVEAAWVYAVAADDFVKARTNFQLAVHRLQDYFGLPQNDNVLDVTLRMKRYGYTIISYEGKVL
jgi:hypothetical protein